MHRAQRAYRVRPAQQPAPVVQCAVRAKAEDEREERGLASEGLVHPVAVRYLKVDGQGVVFNMWHFVHFDDALTAFPRAISGWTTPT